ncbi:MAG: PKD domain-containing protein, partial [Bacteroidota bacterium]
LVQLDGSASSDVEGPIQTYSWDWGGATGATGATPQVTFEVGIYNVTLTVTDGDGATDTDVVTVTVLEETGDTDNDGIPDDEDNCPTVPNADQADFDNDNEGDVCDPDDDNDGVLDADDCDPFNDQIGVATTVYYADFDGDGFGDPGDSQVACSQPDDFVLDGTDNCPAIFNPGQADNDGDLEGDVCDPDDDNDGILDGADCDPFDDQVGAQTLYYADFDGDGFGDPEMSQLACTQPDDYVLDNTDNCPDEFNPDQADSDNDNIGDVCDSAGPGISEFWLEAECAEVGSAWTVVSSGQASNGEYVVRTNGNSTGSAPPDVPMNRLRFTLLDVEAGNYYLFGRASTPTNLDDSFWFRINGGPWIRWFSGFQFNNNFAWYKVVGNPYTLNSGTNIIDFAFREDGARLDKLHIDQDNSLPTGLGPVAENCGPIPNQPPTAVASASPDNGPSPLLVSLSASGSFDNDGNIVSYEWNWNRGSASGDFTTAIFSTGTYNVTLTVTDDDGATDTDVVTIVVFDENTDTDNDDVPDTDDNCPTEPNPDQADFDSDNEGDVCDPDDDNDGVLDIDDCDPFDASVGGPTTYYADFDGDGFGDPGDSQESCTQPDGYVLDNTDNCPDDFNPDQMDTDADGKGDACDLDEPTETEFWLEAECAEVGSAWTIISNPLASNSEYVVRVNGNSTAAPPADVPANQIRFTLENVMGGNYYLFGRVSAPTNLDDSFWFRVNNGEWVRWFSGFQFNENFAWYRAVGDTYALNDGTNVIDFAFREDGSRLDKLHVGLSSSIPGAIGPVAENCNPAAKAISSNRETKPSIGLNRNTLSPEQAETRLVLYPNPTRELLNVRLQSPYSGRVKVMLLDMNGRLLRTIDYDKQAGELGARLRVNTLVPGTYQLRVIQGDRQTIQPFVKLP